MDLEKDMITCTNCKKSKPLKEFYDYKYKKNGKNSWCRDCFNTYGKEYRSKRFKQWYQKKQSEDPSYAKKKQRKWRKANPEKYRDTFLKYKYGISLDDYNQMLKEQNGKCKICHIDQTLTNRLLQVDHNHKTKKVRGLVCCKCNQTIGRFKDDPNYIQLQISLLENTIKYLKEE